MPDRFDDDHGRAGADYEKEVICVEIIETSEGFMMETRWLATSKTGPFDTLIEALEQAQAFIGMAMETTKYLGENHEGQ